MEAWKHGASDKPMQVGGGVKKILYALSTIKRIGLLDSKKALLANNTCKACGLGMGGQRGGMVNEVGEFPAVCNKSIQAQSTDIQAPIPKQIFEYSVDEFKQLSPHELEHIGRLGNPIFKAKDSDKYRVVEWDWAMRYAANKFRATPPDRSFFYVSGRSSNEAGFMLQLLARTYGTNNVNNCSFYCHQATSVGLTSTIGAGTSTVELADLDHCDLIFVIGANPASNHPRFVHKLKACRDRGGKVIVINPAKEPGLVKFALPKSARSMMSGGSEIASHYLQPKIGTDVILFKGLAKWLLENQRQDSGFISKYVEGFEAFSRDVQSLEWATIENATGLSESDIAEVASAYADCKNAVFSWGMGLTHHQHGVENVEYVANLALLRGMVGRIGAGLLPLRGHSNVQGIGTIGVKPVLSDDVFSRMQDSFGINFTANSQGMDTLACLEAAAQNKIDCALIMGGNLYQASPDAVWTKEAMDNIGFKLFLTTTLNYGHMEPNDNSEALILPVAARDEEPQPTTQESMFNYVRLSEGGIQRIENAQSEVDILADLGAQIMSGSNSSVDFKAFKSRQSIRKAIADIVPGMQDLKDIGVAKQEFHIRSRLMPTPDFKTANGKAQMKVRDHRTDFSKDDFPFVLMSVRSEGQFNSIVYEQEDSYRGIKQRWSIMMNAEDMQQQNLVAGDRVNVKSAYGEMTSVELLSFDLPRSNVMVYYPEANVLIGRERDPRSQTPAFKSVAVAVSKTLG